MQIKSDSYTAFNCLYKRLQYIKRRMIIKALSEQKMHRSEPIMMKHVHILLKQLLYCSSAGKPVNMSDRCKRLRMDIIGRFGFGYSLNLETKDANDFVLPGMVDGINRNNIYI
jgi:hypothetical protein